MIRIDFYVLPTADPASRLTACCRLVAKAWQQGLFTFVHCEDATQLETLDTQLWTFRPERFIPHGCWPEDSNSPVLLGLESLPLPHEAGVLVNLGPAPASHPERFSRIIEIVCQAPASLETGRQRFRSYRNQGYRPQRVEL